MTISSGGYGKEFDGNSILINTDRNNYVFIGSRIYSFQAKYEIVEYISPVGNNDVPYPYAIDKNKNIYLMEENIILHNDKINKLDHSHSSLDLIQDPYRYYYDNQETQYLLGFKDYYIDNELDDDKNQIATLCILLLILIDF